MTKQIKVLQPKGNSNVGCLSFHKNRRTRKRAAVAGSTNLKNLNPSRKFLAENNFLQGQTFTFSWPLAELLAKPAQSSSNTVKADHKQSQTHRDELGLGLMELNSHKQTCFWSLTRSLTFNVRSF